MQSLHFTTTINAPVAKVRDTMLNHPTYEARTTAFSAGSTYVGSWEQGEEIKFCDPSGQGMLARIAENRNHEYISIQHMGEIGENQVVNMYASPDSFENYTFTQIDDQTTQLDVAMSSMPDEWVDMFNQMRPQALKLLKELCEK